MFEIRPLVSQYHPQEKLASPLAAETPGYGCPSPRISDSALRSNEISLSLCKAVSI